MNTRFNGINFDRVSLPGINSKAARQAFHDILTDEQMKVTEDTNRSDGRLSKKAKILTESILDFDKL